MDFEDQMFWVKPRGSWLSVGKYGQIIYSFLWRDSKDVAPKDIFLQVSNPQTT